jgi:hypothetical protein
VTFSVRDYDLGRFGSQESEAEYKRLLAEYLSGGLRSGSSAPDVTVNELAVEYLKFAVGHYLKNGKPTKEPEDNPAYGISPSRRVRRRGLINLL